MSKLKIFYKFINSIEDWSEKDLKELSKMLAKPEALRSVSKLIDSAVLWKRAAKAERHNFVNKDSLRMNGEEDFYSNKTERKNKSDFNLKEIRETLITLLNDRSLFKNTKNVVSTINEFFHLDLSYEEFYRRGRRDLIQRALSFLNSLSEEEQIRLIKIFIESLPLYVTEKDSYKELFKILIHHNE